MRKLISKKTINIRIKSQGTVKTKESKDYKIIEILDWFKKSHNNLLERIRIPEKIKIQNKIWNNLITMFNLNRIALQINLLKEVNKM